MPDVRVERVFAFIDLSGFTEFTEQQGDERAVLVLAELRAALRESAARRGVRVVKWLGDGAMLSSTMLDAPPSMILEVQERLARTDRSLKLRAGLDAGPVIMFEGDDYIGRSVNMAARLCDLARAGQVLATTKVVRAVPPWISPTEAAPQAVRGFVGEVGVCELHLGDAGDDPVEDPVCGLVIARHAAVLDGGTGFCSEACLGSWLQSPTWAGHRPEPGSAADARVSSPS
jgi:adenylate cyclase